MSRVSDAADALYAGDPEEFVASRKELASQARAAGDRAAAKEIAALGKPTRSAWLVNLLVREDPSVAERLADLGGQLRDGEAALDGASIRKLSVARRELIDSLVRAAVAQSDEPVSAGVREEITDTFNAALADQDVASLVAAGTVLKAARWAGFSPGVGTALDPAAAFQLGSAAAPPKPSPAKASTGKASPAKASPAKASAEERLEQQRAAAEQAVAEATTASEAAAAAEADQHEAVRIVVERHSADRERLADAERDVADAHERLARAQRAVTQAEHDQAEAEQRLAKSRQSLARERDRLKNTGSTARQAAAALKRAQQALDRLPGQSA